MVNKDVTFVTHCTVDQLYHLMEMSDRWDGPMSGIDFLKPQGRSLAVNILNILRTPDDSFNSPIPIPTKNVPYIFEIRESWSSIRRPDLDHVARDSILSRVPF